MIGDLRHMELLSAAFAAGLLIGVERGWQGRALPPGSRVAGMRTHGILGLAGAVAVMLPEALSAALVLGLAGVIVAGYWRSSGDARARSATGAIVSLLTVGLGALAGGGLWVEALAGAAVTTLILSMRETLHGWLRGMSEVEVDAIVRFGIIALVILPLMPDAPYGPYGAWNPRKIWMVVVLVCGLSFAGYVAARRAGARRGLLLTAMTGAIVSSTAVTAAYARKLRVPSEEEGVLVAGIATASTIMFVRVMTLSAILAPRLLPSLTLSMAPATLVALVLAGLALRKTSISQDGGEVKLGNPLDFAPALLLAGMVAVIALASRWAAQRFGEAGLAVVITLTGTADVDAAVITLAGLPSTQISAWTGGIILAGPVLANTVLKGVMALVIAPNMRGIRAAAPLFASVAAASAALLVMLYR